MKKRNLSRLILLFLVVGCWKGHIAIFNGNNPEPHQIFPRKVETLPPADQEALNAGIIIRNDRDLQQLLEDYLS